MFRRRPFLAVFLVLAACRTATPPPYLPDPTGHGEERNRWLYEQRAYPFGEIPADGRRAALRAVEPDRLRAASEAVGGAAPYWRSIGPQPVETFWPFRTATGRVKAVAVSPVNPQIVLAGSSSGGIWRSEDGGASFIPVSDDQADLSVGAIAFAPSNPQIVYAAMGSDFLGSGFLRSIDSGRHWTLISGPTFSPRGTAIGIAVDPLDRNRIWVAQSSRQDQVTGDVGASGLLRSLDGGVTWTNLLPGLLSGFLANPADPSVLYLGVSRNDAGGSAGLHRSSDGGLTWSIVHSPGGDELASYKIAISAAAPRLVNVHVTLTNRDGTRRLIIASNDDGFIWRPVQPNGLPASTPSFFVADPLRPNVLYIGYAGGDAYRSDDTGATWENLTKARNGEGFFDPENSLAHIDQHALAFDPVDSNILYLGNDGGIYKSLTGGLSFQSLAPSLSIVQAYSISAHPVNASMMFLGTQDNGLERREPGGEWLELITGDYGSVLFDANDPTSFLSNYIRGNIFKFSGNGAEWSGTSASNITFEETDSTPRIGFIAPFEHIRKANAYFFGTWRLFVSTDSGTTWVAPAGKTDLTRGNTDTLSAIGVSDADPNVFYTGSSRGRAMNSRDGGVTWRDVTAGLPNRSIRAIAVDAVLPNVAYIAFSGYRTDHLFVTRNYGSSWQVIRTGLPDVPFNALLIDPRDPNVLYAGTDIGPFRCNVAAATCEYFAAGMPPVVISDFDVAANGTILAATYGRGAWALVEPVPLSRRRAVRR